MDIRDVRRGQLGAHPSGTSKKETAISNRNVQLSATKCYALYIFVQNHRMQRRVRLLMLCIDASVLKTNSLLKISSLWGDWFLSFRKPILCKQIEFPKPWCRPLGNHNLWSAMFSNRDNSRMYMQPNTHSPKDMGVILKPITRQELGLVHWFLLWVWFTCLLGKIILCFMFFLFYRII